MEDGRELTAEASLTKDDAGSWSGTLTFPAEAKTPGLLNLTEGTLRVDGGAGKFVQAGHCGLDRLPGRAGTDPH